MTRTDALRDMKAIFNDHERQVVEELGGSPAGRDVLVRIRAIRRDVVSAIATSRIRRIRGQPYRER